MRAVRRGTLATVVAVGLAACVALALLVAPRASSQPDGLERVAIDEGFAEEAASHALEDLPTADYGVEGIADEGLSTGLAGVLGIAVTFAVAAGAVLLLRRGRPSRAPTGA
jgi:cobalt/nickel transport system permease protein